MSINLAERLRLNDIADRVWDERGLVAIANMRSNGVRDVVIYCLDIVCNHSEVLNVDPLRDDFCLNDIEPRMRCAKCGSRGASIRPYWAHSFGPLPQAKPWPKRASEPDPTAGEARTERLATVVRNLREGEAVDDPAARRCSMHFPLRWRVDDGTLLGTCHVAAC